ncbi:alpha/beta-hydrolase, partial [Stipitochalara longipes BDJ]
QITSSTNLTWSPCLSIFQCSLLEVPLDYSFPNGSKAYIPMLKYPASSKPYQGMVLTNPGGPGDSAIAEVFNNGELLGSIIGSNYDLVGFDPRGIGYSLPSALLCIGSGAVPLKRRAIIPGTNISIGPHGPELTNVFFQAAYDNATRDGEICRQQIGGPGQAGPHMTTLVNAKDIISILDAFAASPEGAGVPGAANLNYWGFSYGTFLGETFASVFPDRVSRMVLDGVVDPQDYVEGLSLEALQFTDEAFSSFFVYCYAAGAEVCPYFTGSSAFDVYLRFTKTIAKLDVETALHQGWQNATDLSQVLLYLKDSLATYAYAPIPRFTTAAQVLLQVEQVLSNMTASSLAPISSAIADVLPIVGEAPAVMCADNGNSLYNSTLKEMSYMINTLKSQSWAYGETVAVLRMNCAGWSIQGTERYSGPFGGHTRTPMLFVSNTRDPITPVYNSQKWFHRFKDAQLLTLDAEGHTSGPTNNTCAFRKINAYFQNGTLPGDDNFCALEIGPANVTLSRGIENVDGWRDIQDALAALRAPVPNAKDY